MQQSLLDKILEIRKRTSRPTEIIVKGSSMNPDLYDGDIITVQSFDSYAASDLLVFWYKQNELLVHRLLKISDNRFYCKGDNSFRLEDITITQIFGKVTAVKRDNKPVPIPYADDLFIKHSLIINRVFIKSGYDIEKTKQSEEYKAYYSKYLQKDGESK